MKQILALVLVFLLIPCAFAESENSPTILVDGLRVRSIKPISENRLLIAGWIGKVGDTTPALRICSLNGEILYEMCAKDEGGTTEYFSDAEYIDEHRILTLQSVPNEYLWTISAYMDGERIGQSAPMENAYRMYGLGDTFIVTSKQLEDIAYDEQVEIRCFDLNGQQKWEKIIPEPLIFNGILTGKNYHIAYGISQDQEDDMGTPWYSFMFAFNDDGEILWELEPLLFTNIIDVAWADDGKVAMIARENLPLDLLYSQKEAQIFALIQDGQIVLRNDDYLQS